MAPNISRNWLVITRDNCSWCDKVKELLEEHEIEFEVYSSEDYPVLKDIIKAAGFRTFPQVICNKVWVGGFMETKDFIEYWIKQENQ